MSSGHRLDRRQLMGAAFATAPAVTSAFAQQTLAPLMVFAAASLQGLLATINADWKLRGGAGIRIVAAATSALARQIEQGAPADLFAAADREWMDWVAERRLIRPETRREIFGNRLVLIAPVSSPLTLAIGPGAGLVTALGSGRLVMGDPDAVPAGRYARAALTSLGLWDGVRARIAATENVRAALALVARGEAPLGIVYETDARIEPRVRIVDRFNPDSHPAIVYPFAVTATSVHPQSLAFLDYMTSLDARRMIEAEGFAMLR
jgi:molybdate transport system substrate-binding protein